MVCGFTEKMGRFTKYLKYYENLEIVEKTIVNITDNFIIFDDKTRCKIERLYCIIK